MWFRDTHPTDQDLILAADGELAARRVERLRKHLASCWECRVRAQELEGAISEFVHLHRRNLDPLLPPPAGSRALLRARLDEIGNSHPPPWRPLLPWRRPLILIAVSSAILVLAILTVPHRWASRPEPRLYASFV